MLAGWARGQALGAAITQILTGWLCMCACVKFYQALHVIACEFPPVAVPWLYENVHSYVTRSRCPGKACFGLHCPGRSSSSFPEIGNPWVIPLLPPGAHISLVSPLPWQPCPDVGNLF